MKNAMLIGVVSLAMITLTACDGGSGSGSGSVTANVNNGTASGATNCTTSTDGSGNLTMTCDNGMTVSAPASSLSAFKGAAGATGATGATGPQGPQGPQGTAATMWILTNGNGSQVGTYLMGGIATASTGYTVWDATNGVAVGYAYNGQPNSGSLYFTSVNCSGTPFAVNTMAVNTVFHNTGVFYKVTSTTGGSHTFYSYLGDGQGCATIGGSGTTATYPEVATYTNANMPAALTLPVTINVQ